MEDKTKPTTWYHDNLSPEINGVSFPVLEKDYQCDVAIIGGGLAGLALAYELSKKNVPYVLVESKKFGDTASGRNGGFCSPGWAANRTALLKRLGNNKSVKLHNISLEGFKWVLERAQKVTSSKCIMGSGHLSLFTYGNEKAVARQLKKENLLFAEDKEFIPGSELEEFTSSPLYKFGIWSRTAFHLNPLYFILSLAKEIMQMNGKIYQESKMLHFERKSNSFEVTIERGHKIKARRIVIATGGYGGKENGFINSRWLPVNTYIGVTSQIGNIVKEHIKTNSSISDTRRAGNYYRLLPENRILWGRGIRAFSNPTTSQIECGIKNDLLKFYPKLLDSVAAYHDLRIDYIWSGKMAYAWHMMPYVGLVEPDLYCLTAFGGHGINTAPAGAIIMAEMLEGDFRRSNVFNSFPLAWNGGLLGSLAAETLYSFMKLNDITRKVFQKKSSVR